MAIKLSKLSAEASKDFLLEVHIITKLQHSRVVSLLGICVEETTLISVYKYFPNGSLEEKLHGESHRLFVSPMLQSEVDHGFSFMDFF